MSSKPGININLHSLINLREAAKLVTLTRNRRIANIFSGNYQSSIRGRGMEFNEMRIYQAGDDIRQMDWRVTARTGKPHIKLYCEEKERPIFLVIDTCHTMSFATRKAFKSVVAAQVAALLGWATVDNGDRLGAIIFNENEQIEFRPKPKMRAALPILKALSDISEEESVKPTKTSAENPFTRTLARLRHVAKPGSLVIIISDFMHFEPSAEKHLSALCQHNEVIACAIHDPIELKPPPPNRYAITNGKNILHFHTGSKQFRKNYLKKFLKQFNYVQTQCKNRMIPYIEVMTTDDVIKKVQSIFGKRWRARA